MLDYASYMPSSTLGYNTRIFKFIVLPIVAMLKLIMSSVPSCIIPVATVNILLLFSLLRFCNDNHIIGMSDNTIWLLYLCTLTFSDQLLSGKGTL